MEEKRRRKEGDASACWTRNSIFGLGQVRSEGGKRRDKRREEGAPRKLREIGKQFSE